MPRSYLPLGFFDGDLGNRMQIYIYIARLLLRKQSNGLSLTFARLLREIEALPDRRYRLAL